MLEALSASTTHKSHLSLSKEAPALRVISKLPLPLTTPIGHQRVLPDGFGRGCITKAEHPSGPETGGVGSLAQGQGGQDAWVMGHQENVSDRDFGKRGLF
jgi:hypothetical protein